MEYALEAMAEDKSETSSKDELFMPKRVNLHEAGIRGSDIIIPKK